MRPNQFSILSKFFFFLFLGVLLLFANLKAQDFELPAHKRRENISFKFIKNLIVVPVFINGKGPFNFVLDTGVGLVLITDYALADSLKLQNLRGFKIKGLGEQEDLDAFITPSLDLMVGAAHAKSVNAAILKKDAFSLSEYVGMPIHGLLGFEFFNSFIVRTSYNNQTLTLFPNRTGFIPRKGYKIPITIEERKPYIETEISLNGGDRRKAKLIIDTGAGHPLSLENDGGVPFPIPDVNIAENLGVGLGGPINGYLARISMLSLGKYDLKEVISAFPNFDDVGAKIILTGRNGNVGNGVLKHFETVFDYSRQTIYLKPSFFFKEKFEHDMSGLELSTTGPDYKRILISRVAENSPADVVGLKPGDELLSINLKPVNNMSIGEINDLFKSGNDRSFLLEVLSKDSTKPCKVIFTLKRRI